MSIKLGRSAVSILNYSFLLTVCYGDNGYIRPRDQYKRLSPFPMSTQKPWMVAGDINVVRWTYEKICGANPRPWAMDEFNACINEAALDDLSLQGPSLTWPNLAQGDNRIHCKLDRILTNQEFLTFSPFKGAV